MTQINAKDVAALRQRTGLSMMECKKALVEAEGDHEQAEILLRKKLKGKIKAMSMEAKASAAIIGALPIVVMGVTYVTNPEYISLLWTEKLGQLMLAGSGIWMLLGVLVMRKMINFEV